MAEPRGGGAQPGRIIDLFAGAGGWDEGLRKLGYSAVGIDVDRWACATARAVGHERIEADITALDPGKFAPVWGLIGSPPCQAYSTIGNGLGKIDKSQVIECARELAAGTDTRATRLRACKDERSLLTVEPLRFALALRPRWIAMEQVPAVAELWSIFAELLEAHGYHGATGLLSAERYGVPQTRKRAFLIASIDGPVDLPAPTHRSFHPRRHKPREDELHLPRWVSMAEALGWGSEPAALRSAQTRLGQTPGGSRRSLGLPSYTLISSSCGWKIEPLSSQDRSKGRREAPPDCRRHEERRRAAAGERGGPVGGIPARTRRRPATCDSRAAGLPGRRLRNGAPSGRVRKGPIRITPEQATVLQGFRHNYPWQGSRLQRFRQIGNTVCPPVARQVLREAMRPSLEKETEAQ